MFTAAPHERALRASIAADMAGDDHLWRREFANLGMTIDRGGASIGDPRFGKLNIHLYPIKISHSLSDRSKHGLRFAVCCTGHIALAVHLRRGLPRAIS